MLGGGGIVPRVSVASLEGCTRVNLCRGSVITMVLLLLAARFLDRWVQAYGQTGMDIMQGITVVLHCTDREGGICMVSCYQSSLLRKAISRSSG